MRLAASRLTTAFGLAFARPISRLFFGVRVFDPETFISAPFAPFRSRIIGCVCQRLAPPKSNLSTR
jgi:hypothetical protein